ncbi:hypothetical protein ACIGBH_40095 [Streptomyces sp. NPDC085929]|uniref:hypothetical protein n=1 Tax=Streptomyces sp. NPDC085929 TaxID=3365739 RepID=UPI0037D4110D
MPDKLPARIRSAVLARLRTCEGVQAVAEDLGVGVREVFRAARTDTGLALALAGVDPDVAEAVGIVGRADYLRLLALGASPSLAFQVLFERGRAGQHLAQGRVGVCCRVRCGGRRDREACGAPPVPVCAGAAAAVPRVSAGGDGDDGGRGKPGITTATLYQRRRRDAGFAAAMDRATATRSTPHRWRRR